MNPEDSLITDPIFVVAVALFAFLTTLLPFLAGMSLLLPLVQTIFLAVFLIMVVRKQHPSQAVRVLCIWSIIQLLVAILVSAFFPEQAEQSIASGFVRRTDFLEWLFTGTLLPDGIMAKPLSRVLETIMVIIGSLLTAGVLGVWLLVRTINLAGYYAGITINSVGSFSGLLAGLPIWTLARIGAYIGFVAILAEPLLTGNWSIGHYLSNPDTFIRRWILIASTILLVLSIIFELLLPGLWRSILAPSV